MPIIYFIDLVLFQECIEFERIKNDFTYKKFQKIKNKYPFIDLLG